MRLVSPVCVCVCVCVCARMQVCVCVTDNEVCHPIDNNFNIKSCVHLHAIL